MNPQIKKLILTEFDYYGLPVNVNQINLWAQELSDLDPSQIAEALNTLRKNPKQTRPALPAQIRDIIFGFPTVEEAWAMCPVSEEDSVVWCEEMAEAYAAVRGLLAQGDTIAARMAFKEVYDKAVTKSKALKAKPRFFASLGFDTAKRDQALSIAVEKNRMTATAALSYSHTLRLPESKNQLLLSAPSEEMTDEQREFNKQKIGQLLTMIKGGKNG